MAPDAARVSDTLVELADTLVTDYDLLEYLDHLLTRSVEILRADAGGVMLFNGDPLINALDLLACTDEQARVLELFELQRQEGPCVDSHRSGELVAVEDLARSDRWPNFTMVALARGYRAAYAFPLRLRGDVIGALNLFRAFPGAAMPDEIRAAQAFADMATIGILQQRATKEARDLAANLQTALNSRVVIEQAKGILAERLGVDMEQAYQTLRGYGRNHNLHLRAVAASVVGGDLTAEKMGRG
jgi:GAF domain-containing protein